MYVCIYVRMNICMYVCMHVCMYVCMHVCLYACMYVCACLRVCAHVRMCVCARLRVRMYACMHGCAYVGVCMVVYVRTSVWLFVSLLACFFCANMMLLQIMNKRILSPRSPKANPRIPRLKRPATPRLRCRVRRQRARGGVRARRCAGAPSHADALSKCYQINEEGNQKSNHHSHADALSKCYQINEDEKSICCRLLSHLLFTLHPLRSGLIVI